MESRDNNVEIMETASLFAELSVILFILSESVKWPNIINKKL